VLTVVERKLGGEGHRRCCECARSVEDSCGGLSLDIVVGRDLVECLDNGLWDEHVVAEQTREEGIEPVAGDDPDNSPARGCRCEPTIVTLVMRTV